MLQTYLCYKYYYSVQLKNKINYFTYITDITDLLVLLIYWTDITDLVILLYFCCCCFVVFFVVFFLLFHWFTDTTEITDFLIWSLILLIKLDTTNDVTDKNHVLILLRLLYLVDLLIFLPWWYELLTGLTDLLILLIYWHYWFTDIAEPVIIMLR